MILNFGRGTWKITIKLKKYLNCLICVYSNYFPYYGLWYKEQRISVIIFPKQVFKKHLPFNKFSTFIPVLLLCKIVQNHLSCYEFGNLKGNFLKNLKNSKFY